MAEQMTSARADLLLRIAQVNREQTDAEIMDAWRAWLYQTFGNGLPEGVLQAVYDTAWQYGHYAGLTEVEGHFIELVELAEKIRAAG